MGIDIQSLALFFFGDAQSDDCIGYFECQDGDHT